MAKTILHQRYTVTVNHKKARKCTDGILCTLFILHIHMLRHTLRSLGSNLTLKFILLCPEGQPVHLDPSAPEP